MVCPELKDVPCWEEPPRIGYCGEPPSPPPPTFPTLLQGIRYGCLKIKTLTLDTLRLV